MICHEVVYYHCIMHVEDLFVTSKFIYPKTSEKVYGNLITPTDKQLLRRKGALFFLARADINKSLREHANFWEDVARHIYSEYYQKEEGGLFKTLQKTAEEITASYKTRIPTFELCLGVYKNGVFYSTAGGGSGVTILRNGSPADILLSSEKVISASGVPKSTDRIVLWNSVFKRHIGNPYLFQKEIDEGFYLNLSKKIEELFKSDSVSPASLVLSFSEHKNIESAVTKEKDNLIQKEASSSSFPPFSFGAVGNWISKQKVRTSYSNESERERSLDHHIGKLYIRRPQEDSSLKVLRKKRLTLWGSIFILLLFGGIVVGLYRKNEKIQEEKYLEIVTQIEKAISEGELVFLSNKEESRKIFVEAKHQSSLLSEEYPEKAEELLKKLSEKEQTLFGEYNLIFEEYFDLSLVSDDFSVKRGSFDMGSVYLLGKNGNIVVRFDIDSKRSSVFAGPSDITEGIDITKGEKSVYVLTKNSIKELEDNQTLGNEHFKEGSLINSFGGNIYVYRSSDKQILKFPAAKNGFEEVRSWLASSDLLLPVGVVDWAIDGSIWIAEKDNLRRFVQGNEVPVNISHITPSLSGITSLFTTEENENLYLLEAIYKRVIVLNKSTGSVKYYFSDLLEQAKTFIVDKEDIFVIGDTKIYKAVLD